MLRNELRGKDSWGLITTKPDGIHMVKGLGTIVKANAMAHLLSNQVLGHTRKATTGAVTEGNAHPFDMGRIIGSHNGMVSNHHSLQTKYNRTFEVDSQHLLAHINDNLPLSEISGYGIVTYIAKEKPNEVMLGVGKQGDLAVAGIGTSAHTIGIVWSSTWTALEDAMFVSGVPKFFQIQIDQGKLYRVKDNDIFNAGKFPLQHGITPSCYEGSAYNNYGKQGRLISFCGEDYTEEKKTILLSKKRRKGLYKALQGCTIALIAGRRALDVPIMPMMTTPLSTSSHSTPGYV